MSLWLLIKLPTVMSALFGLMSRASDWIGSIPEKVIPTLIGTFTGAGLAFLVKRIQDNRDETRRRKAAANFALFGLVQQVNSLVQFGRILAEWRQEENKNHRWFEMKPILAFEEKIEIHIEDLSWLLETRNRNLLGQLMAARNGYLSFLGTLEHRNELKLRINDHLEKEFKKEGLLFPSGDVPGEIVKKHLTERQIIELRLATEDVFTFGEGVLKDHLQVIEDFHKTLKEIWPGGTFIKLESPEAILQGLNLHGKDSENGGRRPVFGPQELRVHRFYIS